MKNYVDVLMLIGIVLVINPYLMKVFSKDIKEYMGSMGDYWIISLLATVGTYMIIEPLHRGNDITFWIRVIGISMSLCQIYIRLCINLFNKLKRHLNKNIEGSNNE